MSKHYDVAVLGGGVAAHATAAHLARRSWRVVVVGNGHRPWRYGYDGLSLGRRSFSLLAGASPVFSRILSEIAQSQTFQRRARALPSVQVLTPELRMDLPTDPAELSREIEREFPAARRLALEVAAEITRTQAAGDAAFREDAVWPPGGFWERRETARFVASLSQEGGAEALVAELPKDHALRRILEAPPRFASHRATSGALSPFAFARLFAAWTRELAELPNGEDEALELFRDRVRAHGGELLLQEQVSKVVTKGSRVAGVELIGGGAFGVQFVVGESTSADLLSLAPDCEPSRRALDAMPRVTPAEHRFVLSLLVRKEALPAPLGREAFVLPAPPDAPLHLQRFDDDDTSLLVVETLVSKPWPADVMRERLLAILEDHLPFLTRHLLVVDSVHDGRPLWDFRGGTRKDVERVLLRNSGGVSSAEPMAPLYDVSPSRLLDLAGDDVRVPVGNAFVVGPSVLPALGQEGELLSAWSVARIITRTDRRKEKMRREMWSKIELR